MRWMGCIMVNPVGGNYTFGFVEVVATCIEIPVIAWKIATRHLDPYAVTNPEELRGRVKVNRQFVHLPRLHQLRSFIAIAISGPQNRLLDVVCPTIRMYVNQLDREVGVASGRRHIENG